MAGSVTTQKLYCAKCKKLTNHTVEWNSEEPKDLIAQCEHFGPRMVSGRTTSRQYGSMTYWFMQDYQPQ